MFLVARVADRGATSATLWCLLSDAHDLFARRVPRTEASAHEIPRLCGRHVFADEHDRQEFRRRRIQRVSMQVCSERCEDAVHSLAPPGDGRVHDWGCHAAQCTATSGETAVSDRGHAQPDGCRADSGAPEQVLRALFRVAVGCAAVTWVTSATTAVVADILGLSVTAWQAGYLDPPRRRPHRRGRRSRRLCSPVVVALAAHDGDQDGTTTSYARRATPCDSVRRADPETRRSPQFAGIVTELQDGRQERRTRLELATLSLGS